MGKQCFYSALHVTVGCATEADVGQCFQIWGGEVACANFVGLPTDGNVSNRKLFDSAVSCISSSFSSSASWVRKCMNSSVLSISAVVFISMATSAKYV